MTKDECMALKRLQQRKDIIIKPADKGGAVVVWDRELYITEANRQLSDSNFYKKEPKDLTLTNLNKVSSALHREIEEKHLPDTAAILVPDHPRCSRFYLLPKIHKPETPGRPVVSACLCPTELLSAYIDDVLKPLVVQLPSYVKDTNHLLNILNDIPDATSKRYLYTMDVKSLYTIIPNADGLRALRFFLEKRSDQTPPTDTIIRLAELVLTLNHFEFNDEFFTQIRGVSMGTRMGPSYACLFMGHIEHMFFQSYDGPIPEIYKRYIDDVFGSTVMPREDLETFITKLDDFHPEVNFTWKISETNLECLDVLMTVNENGIGTSIHYKPTDCHSYLDYSSHHPPRCRNSIPYSQFLRLRRICAVDEDFEHQADNMARFFQNRNYPDYVITDARNRCSTVTRAEALMGADDRESSKIPLVIPFHECTAKISKIVHKNARILSQDDTVGMLFRDNVVTAYKNCQNLRQCLVRSKLPSDELPGTFPCGRPRCKTCTHVSQMDKISGPSGSVYVKDPYTCTSCNVVYAIVCLKCSSIYVGETRRKLSERFREHLSDVRRGSNTSDVAIHFNSNNHDMDDISVLCVATIVDTQRRRLHEAKLINRLGTLYPMGMNREEDSNHKSH